MKISIDKTSFNGTYFFNKTQKRLFGFSTVEHSHSTGMALSKLRKRLHGYQQLANVRLFYNKGDDFIKMSTAGKANRYAPDKRVISFKEMKEADDLGSLLIEKAESILKPLGLLVEKEITPKKASNSKVVNDAYKYENIYTDLVF